MPRIGGLSSGDTGIVDENEEGIPEFCSASCQRFNILCSGGKDGCVCFSIFGIFPVGRIVSKCNNSLLVHNLNSIKLILVHAFSVSPYSNVSCCWPLRPLYPYRKHDNNSMEQCIHVVVVH